MTLRINQDSRNSKLSSSLVIFSLIYGVCLAGISVYFVNFCIVSKHRKLLTNDIPTILALYELTCTKIYNNYINSNIARFSDVQDFMYFQFHNIRTLSQASTKQAEWQVTLSSVKKHVIVIQDKAGMKS